jgi:hypothetical protein
MAPLMATPFISVTDTQGFVDIEPHRRYDNGHSNSPRRRIVIIPIWVVELIILALNVVITGMIISITQSGSGPEENQVQPYEHLVPIMIIFRLTGSRWTVLNMVFETIALVISCTEVMVFVYHDLTPKVFLWSNVIKLVIGFVPIGYQISVTQTPWIKQPPDKTYIAVAFGFSAAA